MKYSLIFTALTSLYAGSVMADTVAYCRDCRLAPKLGCDKLTNPAQTVWHVSVIEERQQECRSNGIGDDISTTLVLYMRNKHALKVEQGKFDGFHKMADALDQQYTQAKAELEAKDDVPTGKDVPSGERSKYKKLAREVQQEKEKLTNLMDRLQKSQAQVLKAKKASKLVKEGLEDIMSGQKTKILAAFPYSDPDSLPSME